MIKPSSKERKILDCPHCGAKSSNMSLSKLKGVTVYREEKITGVVCLECGSSSTSVDTWNMRVEKTRETANIRITVAANGAPTPYSVPPGSTATSLGGNRTFKDDLGLGNNIRILVNGTVTDRRIVDGDVIIVQTLASQTYAKRVERTSQAIPAVKVEYLIYTLKKRNGRMSLSELATWVRRRVQKEELREMLLNRPDVFTVLPSTSRSKLGEVVVLNSYMEDKATTTPEPRKEEVVYVAQPPPKSGDKRPDGAILWQKGVISEKGAPVMESFPKNKQLQRKLQLAVLVKKLIKQPVEKAEHLTGVRRTHTAMVMFVASKGTATGASLIAWINSGVSHPYDNTTFINAWVDLIDAGLLVRKTGTRWSVSATLVATPKAIDIYNQLEPVRYSE